MFEICCQIGCVNNCSYCPQKTIVNAYKSPIKVMSFETFKTCLDKVPKDITIYFAGMSEPFQNPDCIKMVQYAHEQGHEIDIFTTGIGLKLEDIEILKQIPFHYFELHLPDDSNKTSIKVDDYYVEVIANLGLADIKKIHYQVFGKVHPRIETALGFCPEDLSRLLQNRAGYLKDNFNMPVNNLKGSIECRSQGTNIKSSTLLPNGDLTLCCMDYGIEYVFANLIDNTYEGCYETPRYKELIQGLDDESIDVICRKCPYAREMNTAIDYIKAWWYDSKIKRGLYLLYKKLK